MFIAISARDCRTALTAALAGFQATLEGDRKVVRDKSFEQLHAGAVHNGLKPSQADLDRMNEMADNDVEHMMGHHPAKQFIEHCENLLAMLDHDLYSPASVTIDDSDFRLLRKHLPVLRRDPHTGASA